MVLFVGDGFIGEENQDHLEKKVNGGFGASGKGRMASSWKRVSFQAVGWFSWHKVSETVVMLSPSTSEQWRTEVCNLSESQIELPNPTTLNGLIQCLTCVWSHILHSILDHQVSEVQTQAQASHSCRHPTLKIPIQLLIIFLRLCYPSKYT